MTAEDANRAACGAIQDKLNCVSEMAESLDRAFEEKNVIRESLASWTISGGDPGSDDGGNRSDNVRSPTPDSVAKCSSDQESAVTAPLWNPQSRTSSYHTASECRSSPWSDKEEVLDPETNNRRRPIGTSSGSNSFDGSDTSTATSIQYESEGSRKAHNDNEEDTTSSTISQNSRKPSVISMEIADEIEKLSLDAEEFAPKSSTPIECSGKVNEADTTERPDFMVWSRYYQSLINKQTLRSCL